MLHFRTLSLTIAVFILALWLGFGSHGSKTAVSDRTVSPVERSDTLGQRLLPWAQAVSRWWVNLMDNLPEVGNFLYALSTYARCFAEDRRFILS